MVLMPWGVEVSGPFVILLQKGSPLTGLKILQLVFVPEFGAAMGWSWIHDTWDRTAVEEHAFPFGFIWFLAVTLRKRGSII